jgi:hypothetical protein
LPRVIRENEFAAKGANAKKAKTSKTNKDFDRYLTTIPVNGSVADPAKNTFYFCPGPDPIMDGGPFAEWVDEDTYIIDTDKITFIDGSVAVEGDFCVDTSENYRRLYGNGLPNHNIGSFPINKTSEAYKYYKGGLCPIGCFKDASEIDVNPYTLDITLPKNPVCTIKSQPALATSRLALRLSLGLHFMLSMQSLVKMKKNVPTIPLLCYP